MPAVGVSNLERAVLLTSSSIFPGALVLMVSSLCHGVKDELVASKLAAKAVNIMVDPIGKTDDRGRFIGHSTHNFFLHDKKGTDKCLVTVSQHSGMDIKGLGRMLGYKEARHRIAKANSARRKDASQR